MFILGDATQAPCQNHWGAENIVLVLVVISNAYVCCFIAVREQLREQTKQYEKSENDLKALQSVGQVS